MWGCASHGDVNFNLGASYQKWKPLDIPGPKIHFKSDAVVNCVLSVFITSNLTRKKGGGGRGGGGGGGV